MQQGRLQLDADWNEQVDIQNYLRETQSRDMLGAHGAPKSDNAANNSFENFQIRPKEPIDDDLEIAPGRIYVDGILCELEEERDEKGNLVYTTYKQQPNYPPITESETKGNYLAYLDVWQRHITAIDDPEIREVALTSVPDTTTRTKTIWQVKLQKIGDELSQREQVLQAWKAALNIDAERGKLAARLKPTFDSPTSLATNGKQLENQLYRIEIHQSGSVGTATFKWSRNNGTVVSNVQGIKDNVITTNSLSRDESQAFVNGDWIEITNEAQELQGKPGILVRLTEQTFGNKLVFDPGTLTVADDESINLQNISPKDKFKVRRWNQKTSAVLSTNTDWVELENEGIQVKFEGAETFSYRTGDYWLIPVRNDSQYPIEWPTTKDQQPVLKPPQGINHHYCPLTLLKYNGETEDYRPTFPPLVRCLDTAGGVISGSLEIQAGLFVTGKSKDNKYESARVGIGTKQPQARLHIQAVKEAQDPTTIAQIIQAAENQSVNLQEWQDNQGNALIVVTKEGKVGIGYNDITQTAALAIQDNVGIGTNKTDAKLQIEIPTKNTIGQIIKASSEQTANLQEWWSNTNTPATIVTAAGHIGIGVTQPLAALDVQPTWSTTQTSNTLTAVYIKPTFTGNDNIQLNALIVEGGNVGIGTLQPKQQLVIDRGNVGIGYNNLEQTATLAIRGHVGVGTDRPTAKLQIDIDTSNGDGAATTIGQVIKAAKNQNANLQEWQDNQGQVLTCVTQDGNVGIGVSQTNEKLEVNGKIKATSLAVTGEAVVSDRIRTQTATASLFQLSSLPTGDSPTVDGVIEIRDNSGSKQLAFQAENGVNFAFLNGQVVIGTPTEHEAKLNVEGGVKADTLQLADGESVGKFSNDGTLNEGSDRTVPTQQAVKTYVDTKITEVNNALAGKADRQGSANQNFATQDLTVNGVLKFSSGPEVSSFVKNVDFNNSSDRAIPTQLAVKTYVETQITEVNSALAEKADRQGSANQNFATQDLTVNGVLKFSSGPEVSGFITDGDFNNASDRAIPTQLAVKSYVETQLNSERQSRDELLKQKAALHGNASKDFNANALQVSETVSIGPQSARTPPVRTRLHVADGHLYVEGNVSVTGTITGQLSNGCSREIKENIVELSSQETAEILKSISPVKYSYKADQEHLVHAGFISEEMPELVTSSDRKSINLVDLISILTKAVQDDRKTIQRLVNVVNQQNSQIKSLTERLKNLEPQSD
ncbi:MAG: hypothetical protein Fur006_14650 [Coleofasciculaceae cyanobacterium]